MTATAPNRPIHSTRAKITIVAVLALAIGCFTLAVLKTDTKNPDAIRTTGEAQQGGTGTGPSEVVERLAPGRGDEALNQQTVAIDLATGWAVRSFSINKVPVPHDQLDVNVPLARTEYKPAKGKVLSQLPAGTVCVSAVIYPLAGGDNADTRTERWCFEVT